jgi:hypothetical protein
MTTNSAPARVRNGEQMVRDAFLQRAGHAITHIAKSASLEALARALESSTDFGAVARALGEAGMPQSAVELDPLADALARGVAERERLAALAGGLLSASDFARALGGISRQAVDKRRRANQVLAVRVAGDWRYPAAQLGMEGQVLPLLPAILQQAAALGMEAWPMLDFLLAPDDALDGATPLQALQRGDPASAVQRLLNAAQADAFG